MINKQMGRLHSLRRKQDTRKDVNMNETIEILLTTSTVIKAVNLVQRRATHLIINAFKNTVY